MLKIWGEHVIFEHLVDQNFSFQALPKDKNSRKREKKNVHWLVETKTLQFRDYKFFLTLYERNQSLRSFWFPSVLFWISFQFTFQKNCFGQLLHQNTGSYSKNIVLLVSHLVMRQIEHRHCLNSIWISRSVGLTLRMWKSKSCKGSCVFEPL